MTRTTLRHIMQTAWTEARKGAKRFGGQVREFFAAALHGAWNMAKLAQLREKLVSLRSAARRYTAGMNEGEGGFNPAAQATLRLEAQIARLEEEECTERSAARQADQDALWTLEITQQRRAAWNAWVKSASTGGKLHPAQVADRIKELGWGMDELKRAIARHAL